MIHIARFFFSVRYDLITLVENNNDKKDVNEAIIAPELNLKINRNLTDIKPMF